MSIRTYPNLNDLLNLFKKEVFNDLNCINIGIVDSFDITDQTCEIALAIKKVVEIKNDGTKVLEQNDVVLSKVPTIILGGIHNVRVPILKGDFALVFYNDVDIENWFVADTSLPNTQRNHDHSDAIAVTGLHNISNAISDFLNDRISIYWDASNKIEVLSGLVNIITTLCKITANLEVTGTTKLDGATTATSITASGQVEGATLKADNGVSDTVYVASTPGGSPTKSITFVSGIRTA